MNYSSNKDNDNNKVYIKLFEQLYNLLKNIKYDFVISNNLIRYIVVLGDIPKNWYNNIIIYPLEKENMHMEDCIKNTLNNIKLNSKITYSDKYSIKFVLTEENKEYNFVIKERENLSTHNYFFDINNLEYDIKKQSIISKKGINYNFNDDIIKEISKLDICSYLKITDNVYDTLVSSLKKNPIVLLELVELFFDFEENIKNEEVKVFFSNFKELLSKKNDFYKSIKNICNEDDELLFYKKLIKLLYNLEENGLFKDFLYKLTKKYKKLITLIAGIHLDSELFVLFEISSLREFLCLLIFQHLIYNKKKIYKKSRKIKDNNSDDLLEAFINDTINESSETNSNDFNILDDKKFSSLKELKEITKEFIKFENLLNMVSITTEDTYYIKNFYNINMILFTNLKDIKKHHTLKIAYIIRRFHFTPEKILLKIVDIFNKIIKNKNYNEIFLIKDNFLEIITSKKINDYIYKKMTDIPKINNNYKNDLDCIDIMDFQDAIILFLELLYRNPSNEENQENEYFDSLFEASLCEMRSYKIFLNNKKRKQEKKEKKERKEKKKNKYKIVKHEKTKEDIMEVSDENDSMINESSITESSENESIAIESSEIESSETEGNVTESSAIQSNIIENIVID